VGYPADLGIYDANGNKVEENVSGTIHEYVSAFGVTAQMTGQTESSTIVPLPGGVQALYSGGMLQRFRYPDWQGSIRAESDPVARAFTESLAFAPFGERYALKGSPFNVDSFTGKPDQLVPDEYDFPAREEHNGQGRWVSPDPMRGTGNKYVYADNNPLSKVDIYGMYTVSIEGIDTSVDGAIEAAAFSIAESHPTFAVQVGSQATTTQSSGNDSSSSSTQTASGQQQAQAQASQTKGQQVLEAQNLMGKAKAAGTATVNAISDVSDYLNDHPFLALALTLGTSAEKDEPAIEQVVDETATSLETKIEGVEQEIGTVFRSGGSNPGNLTMREGEDALSFRDSLSNPIDSATNPVFRPGSKYIAVDSSKLPDGTVVRDNMPPGHVSVTASPEQIKNAIIDRGKFPQ
jgi:RHS repeat-associated protein